MSEKLIRFLAGELASLRIICKYKDCGTIVEMPLKSLQGNREIIRCPSCNNTLQKAAPDNHLAGLAEILLKFQALDYVDVQFTLPDKS